MPTAAQIEGRRRSQAKYRRAHRDKIKEYSRAYNKRYYQERQEQQIERSAQYRATHRKEMRERWRAKFAADPERFREQCRRYHRAHRDREAKRKREYDKLHPERLRAAARRRRARALQTVGSHTQEQLDALMAQQGHKCADCGTRFSRQTKPTLDHIVPLTRDGTDNIDNLRWTCKPCNSKKHNKPPEEWAKKNGKLFI